ncbi:hypothetical protein DRP05_02275 [Archaeoglobales archaeon]|nr:MAG: hypothetical protein DRP05_02275 [Archaeoglobales archaeon]
MKALLKVLESLARTFTEHNFDVKIRKSNKNVFHIHGDTIYVATNLEFLTDEEAKLRLIVDALNHECEHVNLGFSKDDLRNFIEQTKLGNLARWVLTIVEDYYTDFSRLKRWRGLKKTRALFAKMMMENEAPVNVLCDREAALRGLYMISYCGFAKGEESAKEELKLFFDKSRNLLLRIRNIHEFEERKKIAWEILRGIRKMKPYDFIPYNDLDWKIDFQINCDATQVADEVEFVSCDIDLEKIMEWNGVDDLTPSTFELNIIESIQQLEVEFEKQNELIRGSIAKRDMRIDPTKKVEVEENVVNELKQLLEKIKTEDRLVENEWGEIVNIRNYLRFICGEKWRNLYYTIKPADTGNRAILIALDLSGSMKNKINETLKACHILATASEYLNDKLAAFGFQEKIGLVNYVKFTPIKFWHEKYKPEFFTNLDVFGNTPLKEAVIEAGEWLKPTIAKQKIAFIFTDAEPTSSTVEQVYKAVCRIRHAEVVGVGIGTKINPLMLQSCFENYLWVPDVKDLPTLLFSVYLSFLDNPTSLSVY